MSRAHRVLRIRKRLKIPFEHIETSFLDGSTRHPDFLRVNPNGRVSGADAWRSVCFKIPRPPTPWGILKMFV